MREYLKVEVPEVGIQKKIDILPIVVGNVHFQVNPKVIWGEGQGALLEPQKGTRQSLVGQDHPSFALCLHAKEDDIDTIWHLDQDVGAKLRAGL